MKLSVYIITAIILSAFVLAEEIEIKLIQYDSESTLARIQIKNTLPKSIHNISISIDNSESLFLVGLMFPQNAVVHSRNVPPGLHNVTVASKESARATQEILFTKSLETVKKEIEAQKINRTKQNTTEKTTLSIEQADKKKSNLGLIIFLILLLLFIFAGITFWYLNTHPRQPSAKNPPPQRMQVPIRPVPYQARARSPGELRKLWEEHAKKRQEAIEKIMEK